MSEPNTPENPSSSEGTGPLSRRASRRLVIAMIVIVVAAAAGATYFLVNTARDAEEQTRPVDTMQTDRPSPRR